MFFRIGIPGFYWISRERNLEFSLKLKKGVFTSALQRLVWRALKRPKLEIFGSGFLHKSDLYGKVTWEQGQKIQNFDGLGLKIAILYFLALSPTLLKKVKRCRRQR
jgi:hypothetical protein